jgi:hypothetical protein
VDLSDRAGGGGKSTQPLLDFAGPDAVFLSLLFRPTPRS